MAGFSIEERVAALGLTLAAKSVSRRIDEMEKWLAAGLGAVFTLALPKLPELSAAIDPPSMKVALWLVGVALLLSLVVLVAGAQVAASAAIGEEGQVAIDKIAQAEKADFNLAKFHEAHLKGLWWPAGVGARWAMRKNAAGDFGAPARLLAKISQIQSYAFFAQVVLALLAGAITLGGVK